MCIAPTSEYGQHGRKKKKPDAEAAAAARGQDPSGNIDANFSPERDTYSASERGPKYQRITKQRTVKDYSDLAIPTSVIIGGQEFKTDRKLYEMIDTARGTVDPTDTTTPVHVQRARTAADPNIRAIAADTPANNKRGYSMKGNSPMRRALEKARWEAARDARDTYNLERPAGTSAKNVRLQDYASTAGAEGGFGRTPKESLQGNWIYLPDRKGSLTDKFIEIGKVQALTDVTIKRIDRPTDTNLNAKRIGGRKSAASNFRSTLQTPTRGQGINLPGAARRKNKQEGNLS